MTMLRVFRIVVAVLLIGWCFGSPAQARAQSDAQRDFDRAQELFDQKKYAEALRLFRSAYDETESPNARLMVARTLVEMERLAEAYDEMQATVDEARIKAQTDARYEQTRDAAAAGLALLDPRVGKLVIALAQPQPGVRVTMNGIAVESERLGVPFAVEPGQVVVEASAPDKQPFRREVDIVAGETSTVPVTFVADVGDRDEKKPTGEDDQGGGFGVIRAIGIGVAALGAGGLIAFAVTGSMARSKFKDLEDQCGAARCTDPQFADTVDSGKRLETAANVSAAVGGALLLIGTGMIIFGGPTDDDSDVARLEVLPSAGGVTFAGRF